MKSGKPNCILLYKYVLMKLNIMKPHIAASEPCIFHEDLACKFCDADRPELHKFASGSTKAVVRGLVPLHRDELNAQERIGFPIVTKFEIRKSEDLDNTEDFLVSRLRNISRDFVAGDANIPNRAVTKDERETLEKTMLRFEKKFSDKHTDFQLNFNPRAKKELYRQLRERNLSDTPQAGHRILVRSVEQDCGTPLCDFVHQRHQLKQEIGIQDLKRFIQEVCNIMDYGIFHYDMKNDNITCFKQDNDHLKLMVIDWGYGYQLRNVQELREFAMSVPPRLNWYLTRDNMFQEQNWKPPEFNMFWLLCWLISYNWIDEDSKKEILSPTFTFDKAREMLIDLYGEEDMARLADWSMLYPNLFTNFMWKNVHSEFVNLYERGENYFGVLDNSRLPKIPYRAKVSDAVEYFFPDDHTLENVIARDTDNTVVVNWAFIFRESRKIMRRSNHELPDFLVCLSLKTYYMLNVPDETYNRNDLTTGERMLSERMDCWGYVENFEQLVKRSLPLYETALSEWWIAIYNNPLQPLDTLKTMIRYWDNIINKQLPERQFKVLMRNLFSHVEYVPSSFAPTSSFQTAWPKRTRSRSFYGSGRPSGRRPRIGLPPQNLDAAFTQSDEQGSELDEQGSELDEQGSGTASATEDDLHSMLPPPPPPQNPAHNARYTSPLPTPSELGIRSRTRPDREHMPSVPEDGFFFTPDHGIMAQNAYGMHQSAMSPRAGFDLQAEFMDQNVGILHVPEHGDFGTFDVNLFENDEEPSHLPDLQGRNSGWRDFLA